jgi:hypothetical protein
MNGFVLDANVFIVSDAEIQAGIYQSLAVSGNGGFSKALSFNSRNPIPCVYFKVLQDVSRFDAAIDRLVF